ncbi:glycoside hydrolase family 28 protein [Pseudoduganella umbonata]|nr:glycosyl hydrolase family 28 protein [Pseudoduganella umbonata]MBB3225201.1 alpha-L-rhamnosidase [Pseudoduganella umbonata]
MSHPSTARRGVALSLLAAPMLALPACASLAQPRRAAITDFGALADDRTVNTIAIQKTIDHVAGQGGGTVVVPPGVFVSGALFLKPKVHLHLEQGAVLKCSTDMRHFPAQRTRIEGHFAPSFNPALINANGCDGLKITGAGTLDGAGRPIWDLFWKLRKAAPDPHNFANIGVPRARLALIERSRGVTVEGVTFKDSQFWNLHLYRCQDVTVRGARFEVPDDYKQAPSTDGIDLDSCQRVTVEDCYFSVTDDCIAAKGSKGPQALEDKDSPPVEHIRVRNCEFRRGHGVMTLGSEATLVRDVLVENCRVGPRVQNVAVLKLRADTPQHYEDIHFRGLTLDSDSGLIVAIRPWTQYFNLKGAPPPKSIVRNVSLVGIKGRFGTFGKIAPNPGQTEIGDILLKDIDVALGTGTLDATGAPGLRLENVRVNGKPLTL